MLCCPYSKFNEKHLCEECILTGEKVEGFIMCDFEYDLCPDYIKAQKPIKSSQTVPAPTDTVGGGVKYFQLTVWGTEIELKSKGITRKKAKI